MKPGEAKEFPCYNCTAKDKDHPDYCEYAWAEYNRGQSRLDCLGAK